MARVENYF